MWGSSFRVGRMACRDSVNQATSDVAPMSPRMAASTNGLISPLSLMNSMLVAHSIEQASRFEIRKNCVGSGMSATAT